MHNKTCIKEIGLPSVMFNNTNTIRYLANHVGRKALIRQSQLLFGKKDQKGGRPKSLVTSCNRTITGLKNSTTER